MKQYYIKNDYNKKIRIKLKYRFLIIISITLIIYGIIAINMNLSELPKNHSSFSVTTSSNPPKVVLDFGKRHVVFNTKVFTDFKNGTIIIIKTVKNTIVSLSN